MDNDLIALFDRHGGAATYADLMTVTTRKRLRTLVARGEVVKLWRGIYALAPVSLHQRLAGAGLLYGCP
ncbi:MAG TPA: type IV toxin-antitoxin system AbiEi family antitoxin domain-containing protein [Aldersonia sp.]